MNKHLIDHLEELKDSGMAIIRSAVSRKNIDLIKKSIIKDRIFLEENNKKNLYRISPTLASPAHLGFMLPLTTPYCDDSILSFDLFYSLIESYLGENFYLHEYVCNVALANSNTKQYPHPDQEVNTNGPVGVVCNLAVEKTDASNGMTNVWPKTHLNVINLSTDIYSYSSVQPALEPGDILVRDISLIHQGVGNPSNVDRYLLALVFKPQWEKIAEYAVNNVPISFLETCSEKTKNILRFHGVVNNKNLTAKAYPAPKEIFSGGY
ncbi:MAG TPA: hypothetical protein VJN02_02635 [Gammaproteobacteria bacterium]|nr:hypothetical protein [Gammaproteobacteria bacterium]